MIYLTELSLKTKAAVDVTMTVDPLVASDIDYCLKTWMTDKHGVACRPWRATTLREGSRITGWRGSPPLRDGTNAYMGHREFTVERDQPVSFAGRFIALRRNPRVTRDAAAGRTDPAAAYEAWLRERLVDVMPSASIDAVVIDGFASRRVLRKISRERCDARVQQGVIPVVEATVAMTVLDPAGLEAWLLRGVGPQKAFGYGAFLPTVDGRSGP
jgi:hypothetical protein